MSAILPRPGGATTDLNLSLTVCGLWNARNGFGGYNGFGAYKGQFWSHDQGKTYDLSSFNLLEMFEPGWEAQNLLSFCESSGIKVSE